MSIAQTNQRICILFEQHAQIATLEQLAMLIADRATPVDVEVSLALQGASSSTPEQLYIRYRRDDSQPDPPSLTIAHRLIHYQSGQTLPCFAEDRHYPIELRFLGGLNMYGCERACFAVNEVAHMFIRHCQPTP